MQLPKTACPITYSCAAAFRAVEDSIFADTLTGSEEDWEDLDEDILDQANLSDVAIRLRAFYALELVYTKVLGVQAAAPGAALHIAPKPRTLAGLEDLRGCLTKLERRYKATQTNNKLKNDKQLAYANENVSKVLLTLQEMTEVARGMLASGPVKGKVRMGYLLARVFHETYMSDQTVIEYIRPLLRISVEEALHPWDTDT